MTKISISSPSLAVLELMGGFSFGVDIQIPDSVLFKNNNTHDLTLIKQAKACVIRQQQRPSYNQICQSGK